MTLFISIRGDKSLMVEAALTELFFAIYEDVLQIRREDNSKVIF